MRSWFVLFVVALGLLGPSGGPPVRAAETSPQRGLDVDPADEATYAQALALARERRNDESLQVLLPLARKSPTNHVLGLLLSTVASTRHDQAAAERLMAEADAAPSDPLLQLMAGVAVHYCGHIEGRTRAEKAHFYGLALRYLERVFPAYDHVVRAWLYVAVTHFRLGRQAEAEAALRQAEARNSYGDDADTFYCRAEIRQRVDPTGALADLDRYEAIMTRNLASGAFGDANKAGRLAGMRARFEAAVRDGEGAEATDLFDPIRVAPPPPERTLSEPVLVVSAALVLLLGLGLAVRRFVRARRS
jgi:tetratricopeptide (TPR) repeat protein